MSGNIILQFFCGDVPEWGMASKVFIPYIYDICIREYRQDAINHKILKSKRGEKNMSNQEAITLLNKVWYSHIGKPNKEAIKEGRPVPYGKIENTVSINETLSQTEPISHIDTETTVTEAQATLNKYRVSFTYTLGKFLSKKTKKFNSEYNGLDEVQVYLDALNDLYNMIDFRKINIKQSSINVIKID